MRCRPGRHIANPSFSTPASVSLPEEIPTYAEVEKKGVRKGNTTATARRHLSARYGTI
jgi:hypothetical protein